MAMKKVAAKKVVAKKATGGMISVVVAKLMDNLITIKVKKGASIQEVLDACSIKMSSSDAQDLTVNGASANLTDKVKAGDIIAVMPQVDGGKF